MTEQSEVRTFETPFFRAVLSFGSNLGDSESLIAWAVARARETGTVQAVSAMYSTPPWGDTEQDYFCNVTVIVESPLTPRQWLLWGNNLEALAMRSRDRRWGPRTMDVDIIHCERIGADGKWMVVLSDDPDLLLPHPRAAERAFVLLPWLELEPKAMLSGTSVSDLLAATPAADRSAITRIGDVPVVDSATPPGGESDRQNFGDDGL